MKRITFAKMMDRSTLRVTLLFLVSATVGCVNPWPRGDNVRVVPMVHVDESQERAPGKPSDSDGAPKTASEPVTTPTAASVSDAEGPRVAAHGEGSSSTVVQELLKEYRSSLMQLPPEESAQRMAALMRVLETAERMPPPAANTGSGVTQQNQHTGAAEVAPSQRRRAADAADTLPARPAPASSSTAQARKVALDEAAYSESPGRQAAVVRATGRGNATGAKPVGSGSAGEANQTAASQEQQRGPSEGAAESQGDWQEQLRLAIEDLSRELAIPDDEQSLTATELGRREVLLKMLQIMVGDAEDALTEFRYNRGREAAFWRDELFALHLGVRENRTPVLSQRAARMLEHLRNADRELAAVSALDLRGAAFCKNVWGYADVEPFRPYRFKPDQEVLLYVEVENFATERLDSAGEEQSTARHATKYETEFRGSYQILDGEQRRVADQQLPVARQASGVQIRDYYIAYRIYMPRNIPAGHYTLELTLEDVKGEKFGQAFLDFEISTR